MYGWNAPLGLVVPLQAFSSSRPFGLRVGACPTRPLFLFVPRGTRYAAAVAEYLARLSATILGYGAIKP